MLSLPSQLRKFPLQLFSSQLCESHFVFARHRRRPWFFNLPQPLCFLSLSTNLIFPRIMSAAAVEDECAVAEAQLQRAETELAEEETFEQLPQSFILIDELQQCGVSATDIKVRARLSVTHSAFARPSRSLAPSARSLTPPAPFFSPAQKVKDAGFATVKSLLTVPKKTLIDVKGLSDAKVDKMLEAANKLLPKDQAGSFVTAKEWMSMVRALSRFLLFSPSPR